MEKLPEHVPSWHVIATLRRIVRMLFLVGGSAVTLVLLAFSLFNWGVLPRLDHYRPRLEQELAHATGRPVHIARLSGLWEGLAPRLALEGLSITDTRGGQALTLSRVDIKPSWMSLFTLEPRLALVEIRGPELSLRRSRDDELFLNGFPLTHGTSDGQFGNWLLRQSVSLCIGQRWHTVHQQ